MPTENSIRSVYDRFCQNGSNLQQAGRAKNSKKLRKNNLKKFWAKTIKLLAIKLNFLKVIH